MTGDSVTPRPGWLGELTLPTEAPWLPMGARALRAGSAFQTDGPGFDQLRARKLELLASAHREVSVELPDFAAPISEASHHVADVTGRPIQDNRPVLEAAALLVAEDLVVLVRALGAWRMVAAVVCFPSHWSPASKLGLPVASIHQPVPRYAEELSDRVDRFLDHLAPERVVWRRNWTVHASPELHAPRPVPVSAPVAPADHWLRSERQTLTLLPLTGAILFAIRTEQVRLAALQDQPYVACRLAAAVRSSPPDLARYRFGGIDREGVASWLESSRASSPGAATAVCAR
jgi:Protein of unknown function (DUF3445)